MNDICQICGRKLVHAPAFTDGTPIFVGYFPCDCSRDVYLKRRAEVQCQTYREYLEDHLGITNYNIIYKALSKNDLLFRIGFTGTQHGMTPKQLEVVDRLLKRCHNWATERDGHIETHSGDCIGADTDFFHLIPDSIYIKTFGHIPNINTKRSFCEYNYEFTPLPYLDRNKKIVEHCDILIATPAQDTEQLRSGTWSTIRYAKKTGKRLKIIFQNGYEMDYA